MEEKGAQSREYVGSWTLARRFWGFVRPYQRLYVLTLALNVVGPLFALVFPYVLRLMLTEDAFARPRVFWGLLAIAFLSIVLRAVNNGVRLYWGHVVSQKVCMDARNGLLAHIQKLSMTFHDNERTGKLLSRVIDDLNLIEEMTFHGPEAVLTSLTYVIGAGVLMFAWNWRLALVGVGVTPFLAAFGWLIGRRMLAAFREVRKRIAEVTARAEDNLTGIQVIKSFVREEFEEERFDEVNQEHYASRLKVLGPMAMMFPGTQLISGAGVVAVIGYGSHLMMQGEVQVGELAAFVWILMQFQWPILNLTMIIERFASFFASLERLFRYLDIAPEVTEGEGGRMVEGLRGEVEFEDVHFAYGEIPVLRGVSFSARPGQMVALVGPSGAGKTTTVSLIPGFYRPQSGVIRIDGQDIAELELRSLRRHIGIVMQDDHLFADTVRENIAYGRLDADEGEIVEAAKAANAHGFILDLAKGYDTEVGERGVKLSEGQKQRVSIARAILKDPKILLLDEATSSVDTETERLIQEAFERLRAGRTTFVIAHRLSTVLTADEILFVQEGRIEERGTHAELMEKDGLYRRFYDAQFSARTAGGSV